MHNIIYLNLKTKLLFMMVFLCTIFVAFLLILYSRAEKDLMDEFRHHTEDLSTAIQISIEQMAKANEGGSVDRFKGLTNFRKKGIKEISVINNSRDVIASSNPHLIGKKLQISGETIKSIGKVEEYTTTRDGQKKYDILLPVVVGNERLGYIHIETTFEDFAAFARENHRSRLIGTIITFGIGILVAMYLSKRYTDPIQNIADAAKKVAGGDLSIKLDVDAERKDEIGMLAENFNYMIMKLSENRDLQSRLKEAEHMSKIGVLASGIAHEVRNPLNLINLSIDHLRSVNAPEDPQKREVFLSTVANIKSEIERLDEMISNFLNFGKPLNLTFKDMPVNTVLNETLALVSERCSEQKINIEARLAGDPVIPADYRHVKACFLNILLNSVQAMPEGGSMTVESAINGRFVSINVEDTGCGICPENMEKIFEPYFTTKDIGIGLGLAMTKRVVEEHGGRIFVESALGKGTRITINLPLSAGA